MNVVPPATYLKSIPGLSEAVAKAHPTANHAALQAILDQQSLLQGGEFVTSRGDAWLAQRKVFDRAGTWVSDDHRIWLAQQLASDRGNASATYRRLRDQGYQLTKCEITTLYFVAGGDSGDPSHFLQIEIYLESETLSCELFISDDYRQPTDIEDLITTFIGDTLPVEQRRPVQPLCYRLHRIIDVEAWLAVADALEEVRREDFSERRWKVTSSDKDAGSTTIQSADELFPGWAKHAPKHRRLFHDWERSSAGTQRLCDHWVLQLTDYTAPNGKRTMELIPLWTFARPLAKVNAVHGSEYEFFGKLQKIDRRVGVSFGWYFYMLHGNRVESDAGDRVIAAAETGVIVLPEQDYRVLKDWQTNPYGF